MSRSIAMDGVRIDIFGASRSPAGANRRRSASTNMLINMMFCPLNFG
jgi:hypothetical protein